MTRRAGFLAGLLAAGLAALPGAWRFESGLRWQAYWVCLGGCAVVMAPLSAVLASSSPSRFRSALTLGALLSVLPLLAFSTILKTSTHHRPLGGLTFAVIAGLFMVGLSLACARWITWAGAQHAVGRSVIRWVLVGLSALGMATLLLALTRGLAGGDGYRTGIFDALRVLGLATLAARVRIPERLLRGLRGLGLAAWIAVVTVGVCLGRAPAMQAELALRCPVLHWPLVWLGG